MKNKEENIVPTIEEALQDQAHARFHEALRYVQNKPFSQLFPKKHELSLIDLVKVKVKLLHEINPKMPIKKVITTVFESLTDDISAPLMLKLTKIIIDKWGKLSVSLHQERLIAVAA